ncbi:Hippocampus abundant transcript 1 protein [Geodia barretti]|uniref:Hippocampus abundant transcript 1 protein n=1 Tax=Geodia barretti TaxID=519541 RepID=A0AA35W2S0_GEOBA|nr:Hippocampus abundant transcript 1 protein [Geodia barretti]
MEKLRKSKTLKKLKTLFGGSKRTGRGPGRPRSPVSSRCDVVEGYGRPSVVHATIVIFLEFFAWGLLTSPTIEALKTAFPTGTFLKNGIIQGIKGLLSFLSAPLIGALSDAWGRKSFLLLSVFMTCAPIPILLFSPVAYFVAVAISGVFAVTFSIVFAYVADCTIEDDRSSAYGLVSATFAASLVISPALGTWIEDHTHGQAQVILLATMITIFNLVFIVFMVPESLPEKSRKASWGAPITWEQADPFCGIHNPYYLPLVPPPLPLTAFLLIL